MQVTDKEGKSRRMQPGETAKFSKHGSEVVLQKDGSLKLAKPKGIGKKQRKRPPKQKKKATAIN